MKSISAISATLILFLFSPIYANKDTSFARCYCNFKGYQDTSGTGQFNWNGDYFSGTITIFKGNNNKLEASWEFVKIFSIDNFKTIYCTPSVAYSYECGTSFPQINNIKINGDQILFDLYPDAACEDCSVFHFIGNKKTRNSFVGTGVQKSFIDNKMDRYEYRPISEIELPKTKIK